MMVFLVHYLLLHRAWKGDTKRKKGLDLRARWETLDGLQQYGIGFIAAVAGSMMRRWPDSSDKGQLLRTSWEVVPMEVTNDNLNEDDLPPPNCHDSSVLTKFALSFNGYHYWGSKAKCEEIAKNVWEYWQDKNELPRSFTLAHLRTSLFIEQRLAHWDGPWRFPTDFSFALVEAIRGKIRERDLWTKLQVSHTVGVDDEKGPSTGAVPVNAS
jgi:hypothetical protein